MVIFGVNKDNETAHRSSSGGFQVNSIEQLSDDESSSIDVTDKVLKNDRGMLFQNDNELKEQISKTLGFPEDGIKITYSINN